MLVFASALAAILLGRPAMEAQSPRPGSDRKKSHQGLPEGGYGHPATRVRFGARAQMLRGYGLSSTIRLVDRWRAE